MDYLSHLLFCIDEDVLSRSMTIRNSLKIRNIFHEYWQSSSQQVSPQKCQIMSEVINNTRLHSNTTILGYYMGSLPFDYLGSYIQR